MQHLKTIFLVNALLLACTCAFVEAAMLCKDLHLSPWIAGVGFIAVYCTLIWRECRS
jgi:hypothetical protein